jgi:hypothetical protein
VARRRVSEGGNPKSEGPKSEEHTTVGRRWVRERLKMGDESRVTQAIGRVRDGVEAGLDRLKERLEQAYQSRATAKP